MHKHVCPVIPADKSISFGIVEPLDRTFQTFHLRPLGHRTFLIQSMPSDFLPFSGYSKRLSRETNDGRSTKRWLFVTLAAGPLLIEPEYARYGFAIVEATGRYHADGDAQREKFRLDDFIFLRLRDAGTQACRHVNGHSFGDKTGAGIKLQDSLPAGASITGFLEQFAFGRSQFVFSLINAARAEFPEILLSGMSILAHQQHVRLGMGLVNRENHDRAGVVHDVATATHAGRLQHLISRDPKGWATVGFDRRKNASFGLGMG